MAACGTEFQDDNKYDHSDEELRLDNVCDFPTTQNEIFSSDKKECLLLKDSEGNVIDRRVHILYKKKQFHVGSYFMLCQITAHATNPKMTDTGSGCFDLFSNDLRYLTCAHNLKRYSSRTGAMITHRGLKVYQARQGWKRCVASGTLDYERIFTHPKYNGQATCGFDIGMFWVKKLKKRHPKEVEKSHGLVDSVLNDVIWHYVKPKDLKAGMAVEVAGFPGEKLGEPYTAKGKIVDISVTKHGGHLIWYDADSTPGNSGSCIMITDPDFVKTVTEKPEVKKVVVAVHVAYDGAENLNFGTLITESIYDWIQKLSK